MADSFLTSLHGFYDSVDKAVDAADLVLNRSKRVDDKIRETAARAKPSRVIDADVVEKKAPKASVASAKAKPSTAVSRKPHFYIVESVTTTGTVYVVTDGGNARTECSSREFAEKILQSLKGGL